MLLLRAMGLHVIAYVRSWRKLLEAITAQTLKERYFLDAITAPLH
jgi:hypothetical protein